MERAVGYRERESDSAPVASGMIPLRRATCGGGLRDQQEARKQAGAWAGIQGRGPARESIPLRRARRAGGVDTIGAQRVVERALT